MSGETTAAKMANVAAFSCIISTDVSYYMNMWRPVLRTYASSINISRENGVSFLPNGEGKITTRAKIVSTGTDMTGLKWDIAN